jgi:hypothetical protein
MLFMCAFFRTPKEKIRHDRLLFKNSFVFNFMNNFTSNRYRTNATSSSPATGRSARRTSQGAAATSSLPSPSFFDSLTRSGSFALLSELFNTERLFELRDFRIARVMPKGEAVEQFAASMHLVLDLADKYPREYLAAHILDCVAQFLPALLCPGTRRGRVRQIISNAKRFQRGDWKYLWETALRLARRETDNNVKQKHNRAKRDASSVRRE